MCRMSTFIATRKTHLLVIFLGVFVAIFGARIAWTVYSTFVVAFPENLEDPFRDVVMSSNSSYQCIPHGNIMTIEGVTKFEEAMAIIAEQGYVGAQPILFKQFLPDHALRLQQISTMYKDSNIVFTEVQLEAFGNLWIEGRRYVIVLFLNIVSVA